MAIAHFENYPQEPTDPGVAARQRALEEGSGWSPHSARIATDPNPGISGTQDPPRQPRLPRIPRVMVPPRRVRDGDSGLDPHWNVPRTQLTPEQAAGRIAGLKVVRGVLAKEGSEPDQQTSAPEIWKLPRKQTAEILLILNDSRAGFVPKTSGELSLATSMLPYLNLRQDEDRVSPYLLAEHTNIKRHYTKRGLTEHDAIAEADSAILDVAKMVKRYGDDSLQAQIALKALDDACREIITGRRVELFSTASLYQIVQTNKTLIAGALVLAQRVMLKETAATSKSPAGVDPFRNLGVTFDAIAAKIVDGSTGGKSSKQEQMIEYLIRWMNGVTASQIVKSLSRSRAEESKRLQYWNRVKSGLPIEYQRAIA